MTEEYNEIEESRKILNKEVGKIDVYDRLLLNPDFKIFKKELIDDKVEALFDILETADDKDLARIRGQMEALRGIKKIFEFTISRKKEVNKKLNELEKSK